MHKLLNLSLIGLLLASPISAIAATQTITEVQAQGESGAIPTIKLALNVGVPIKMPNGWRIYKGWLDNNTLAEVDGDRSFEQGATILFLVGRKAGAGKLSMVVRDANGADHLFVLRIVAGAKSSPDIVFVKDGHSGNLSVKAGAQTPVDAIRQGMQVAAEQGRLVRGSELWQSIESFNRLVSQGLSSDSASRQTGVNLAVIEQLLHLGKNAPAVSPIPTEPIPKKPNFDGGVVSLPSPKTKKVKLAQRSKPHKVEVLSSAKADLDIAQTSFLAAVPALKPVRTDSFPQKKYKPVGTYSIANGLVRGLRSPKNKIAKRGSDTFDKLWTVVWLLRSGKPLKDACKEADVKLKTAKTILAYGGVDLSKRGFR
jgi:hypothetical protein